MNTTTHPESSRPNFELPVVEVPKYEALAWFIRWGRALATVMFAAPVAGGAVLAGTGATWWIVPAGVLVGGVAAILTLVVQDLARVISDMLLPR
jgi:4-hydroxybenzoate polyprenyltransferase